MNEVSGPSSSPPPSDFGSHQVNRGASIRSDSANQAAKAYQRTAERAPIDDSASLSVEGRSLSQLKSLPEARAQLVERLSAEVNDPAFDLDGKFADAMDSMLSDVFGDAEEA